MSRQASLATIILAAGKGTRMKSSKAKVLHEVFYQPMIHHVLKAIEPLKTGKSVVIVGHQRQEVEQVLSNHNVTCVEQLEQKGTGHAVLCAESFLSDFMGDVLILCGDSPLLLTKHLEQMYLKHSSGNTPLSIMTTSLKNPTNYGRIITDDSGSVIEIIEEKDATPRQRLIKEINAGIYCVKKDFLFEALKQITTDNSQGEMYLTDIVAIAVRNGFKVEKYEHPYSAHVLGVNSRAELSQAHTAIQARRNRELMDAGITMHNPLTTSVAPTVSVARDCILAPQVTISGNSSIGSGCIIEPGVFMTDTVIGNDVSIGANSVLSHCRIKNETKIAPLSHIDSDD